MWEEWRYLQKSKKTRVDEKRQQKFGENLDKLWDIGALDAIEQIQKKTDLCPSLTKLRTLPSLWTRAVLGRGLSEGAAWYSLKKEATRREERN